MNFDKQALNLYLVTDRTWLGNRSLSEDVTVALKSGITFLQLREKNMDKEAFFKEAVQIKRIAEVYNVPFVINDDVELALSVDADGVHIGQDDMAISEARKKLGKDKILGVSVRTVEEAKDAEKNGADYLGVGAVFSTTTKLDAADVSYEILKEICHSVAIPVVAIGGINHDNVASLEGSGIDGIAVISAILAKDNIQEATESLLEKCRKLF